MHLFMSSASEKLIFVMNYNLTSREYGTKNCVQISYIQSRS